MLVLWTNLKGVPEAFPGPNLRFPRKAKGLFGSIIHKSDAPTQHWLFVMKNNQCCVVASLKWIMDPIIF